MMIIEVTGIVLLVLVSVFLFIEYCLSGLRDKVCTPVGEHPDDDPYLKGEELSMIKPYGKKFWQVMARRGVMRYTRREIKTVGDLIEVLNEADPDSLILCEDGYHGDYFEIESGGIMPFHLNQQHGEWQNPHVLVEDGDDHPGVEAIALSFRKVE